MSAVQSDEVTMNIALPSEINVGDERSGGNVSLLDIVNDPFFFGKASSVDRGLLVELKRLEILIHERRSALEQLLASDSSSVQGLVQVSPLTASLVDASWSAPSELVK